MTVSADQAEGATLQARPAERPRRLGKGLGALLGETRREEPLARSDAGPEAASPSGYVLDSPLRMLPVGAIRPLPGNPRKHFDDAALDELAASIATRGVIQPIIVRPMGEGYELVAGERRWRAAQKAQLHEIPALVRTLSDREVMALALIENLQREDLNPVEEARAYQRLSEGEGMTQAEIARMVEKSRSHVANIQRLLHLPEAVLDLVEQGQLSMGHARALIGQDDAAGLAQRAVKDGLSVREVEHLVRSAGQAAQPSRNAANTMPKIDADILAVQGHLEEFLGLTVRIKSERDQTKGTISIRYTTIDQLDLVCQRLTAGEF